MNGLQHMLTTVVLAALVLQLAGNLPVSVVEGFILGAFLSCHSANLYGLNAFSPDMDLYVSRLIGKNIHRKPYFHSYFFTFLFVWPANILMLANPGMPRASNFIIALLFGMAFGWNAHIWEDWVVAKNKKKAFKWWVLLTSLLAMITAYTGVLTLVNNPEAIKIYNALYNTLYLGFIGNKIGAWIVLKFNSLLHAL